MSDRKRCFSNKGRCYYLRFNHIKNSDKIDIKCNLHGKFLSCNAENKELKEVYCICHKLKRSNQQ